ncbi:Rv3654c family TadE-like protein [Agromyces sp. GXQ0307]|uniref:Rv3654c family TadE-like protein n=1 Tax=Agromyces sp. GXQ0307 TaxID=3377835 RepID=UPI00383A4F55
MRGRSVRRRFRAGRFREGRVIDDGGAATVVAVAIVGAVVLMAVAVVGVLGASIAAQRAANAADASALAAADAISGAVAGEPCPVASDLARRNGASVVECRADGPVAFVSVVVRFGPMHATASARAGPPGWGG